MRNQEQFLCLSMYTYLNLLKQGDQVMRFIDQALELVQPFSDDLRVRPWYLDGTHGHVSTFDQRAQRRIKDQLLAGKLEWLQIAQRDWEDERVPPRVNLELGLASQLALLSYQRLRHPSLPKEYLPDQTVAKSLNLAIRRDAINPDEYPRLFDALIDLGLWTVENLDAVYGLVSLGSFQGGVYDFTRYERHQGLGHTFDVEHALRDKCRGVFHVNFLTKGHIAALGDLESLTSLPAVAGIQSMRLHDRDLLILNVGEPQTPLSETQIQAVEEHIKPILLHRPVEVVVDLINPEIVGEIGSAMQRLEALLPPSRIVTLPDGGVLVFRHTAEENLKQPAEHTETSRRIFEMYQESLNSFLGPGLIREIYPEWRLTRINRHENARRLPYLSRSSLIDAKPFETTLWLGSKPTQQVKQALTNLFSEWARFSYPDQISEGPGIDILDVRFQEREVIVQAEMRVHRGFALATLISMLDLFSLNQARIAELVLGRIEDLDSLLAKAGQ